MANNQELRFGLCGLGVVGSGVVRAWQQNQQQIQRQCASKVNLAHIGARSNKHGCNLAYYKLSQDIFAVVNDPELDVVIELIGGEDVALELVLAALENGKDVVTANKALLAKHAEQIFAQARKYQRQVRFEAAVAGGIPIIKTVSEALAANQINAITGIINGTCNYILSRLEHHGDDFATALSNAQQAGYAEADPSFDIGGIDAAHKIAILARLAFNRSIDFAQVYCRGISDINADDVNFASELGYSIKALARTAIDPGSGAIEISSQPLLVEQSAQLAAIDGVNNALVIDSEPLNGLLLVGAGAGAGATASSVLSDLLDLSRNRAYQCPPYGQNLPAAQIKASGSGSGQYFLCLHVRDRIGVLNRITELLLRHNISVRNLIQKPMPTTEAQAAEDNIAMVALLTHSAKEAEFNQAIKNLQTLPELKDQRVHSLGVWN